MEYDEYENNENKAVILEADDKTAYNMPESGAPEERGKRKEGLLIRTRTAVIICIICSLMCGMLSAGTFALINKNKAGSGDIDSDPVYPSINAPAGSNISAEANGTGNQEASGNVNINVENVTSPATAVAKKVSPSIVGIRVTTVTNYGPYGDYSSSGEGSGIIYTSDGYIITNYHVIENMITSSGEKNPNSTMSVFLYQSTTDEYEGKVIGYDQSADLAVIKIEASGLTPVEIGNSDEINVGDIAIAIGNPGGLEFMGSTSQGIISGLNREIQTEGSYENLKLIQTDAAINPGNSGGALCDVSGRLIGVNSVKLVDTSYEGMGFAIPVNDAIRICDDIIKNGPSQSVYLGLEFNENYTPELLKRQGYPEGIVISSIAAGSPAELAGFEEDDILTSFNGVAISSTADLIKAKRSCQPGQTVYAKVYRLSLQGNGFIQRWVGEYVDVAVTFE